MGGPFLCRLRGVSVTTACYRQFSSALTQERGQTEISGELNKWNARDAAGRGVRPEDFPVAFSSGLIVQVNDRALRFAPAIQVKSLEGLRGFELDVAVEEAHVGPSVQ